MVLIHLLDGAQARHLADDLRELYAEVYAEPPYHEGPEHVAKFADLFSQDLQRAGFSLASAVDDGRLVGAAYGWTMASGEWVRDATNEPPDHIRSSPKFVIREWIVRRSHRGGGIGQRLLDLVLTERPEPYAILSANPDAPARSIYERLGWRHCGFSKPDLLPRMDILSLSLSQTTEPEPGA
jgi:GNAT superfamily N-acetyltransferase